MGPTIIIDKSVLHQLTSNEIWLLNKLYTINVPEVLLLEIVSDLYKNNKFESEDVEALQRVALKLDIPFMVINMRHPELIAYSLLGKDCLNDRRPVLQGVPDKKGYGVIIDKNPYQERLARWRKGVVNQQDIDDALEWRRASHKTSTKSILSILKEIGIAFDKYVGLTDIVESVNSMLELVDTQLVLLRAIVETTIIDPRLRREVFDRWDKLGKPKLKDFAPYAHFCWSIQFCFIYCVDSQICGLRQTDICDLQYVMYLPFCDVFCSHDIFHKTFVPEVKQTEQTFVTGDDLKSDLSNILTTLKKDPSYNENSLRDLKSMYPPKDDNSFTYRMWKKYTTLIPTSFADIVESCMSSNKEK